MKYNQSGNVLFYILIAVALLAALSYTVAQSGRGSVSSINRERAYIYATEIIEYGNILSQAVSQIKLRGYNDNQISFENNKISGYSNSNCTDDECKIFHINGGSLTWLDPPKSSNDGTDWLITVNEINNIGTSNADLILLLQNIDQEICKQINNKLHGTTVIPQESDTINLSKFTGNYTGSVISDASNIISGNYSYCFEGGTTPPTGTYHYYQVLIAR